MSYCVNCGVELNPAATACPLCQTPVVNPQQVPDPGAPAFFPTRPTEISPVSRLHLALLLTAMLASMAGCCALLNLFLRPQTPWSLFVVGAAAMLWIWFALPLLVRSAPGWLKLTLDVVAVGLYVYLISLALDDGAWFAPLALPILILAAVLVFLLSWLLRDGRRSILTTLILILVAVAVFLLGVELFYDLFRYDSWSPSWSLIVCAVCLGLCIPLLVVRRVPALREEARRRFHV